MVKINSRIYLTAGDANAIKKKSCEITKLTLEKIIERCETTIRFSAERKKSDVIWEVPMFIDKSPVFNPLLMTIKLGLHLTKKNYHVKIMGMNLIYISWRYS